MESKVKANENFNTTANLPANTMLKKRERPEQDIADIKENHPRNLLQMSNETKCLLITNLQRQSVNSLHEFLEQSGNVVRFWMDLIKTNCYVEYETIEQAKASKDALNAKNWVNDGKKLVAEFANEEAISGAMLGKRSPFELFKEKENVGQKTCETSKIQGETRVDSTKVKVDLPNNNVTASDSANACNKIANSPSLNKKTNSNHVLKLPKDGNDEPVKTLDNLFRKTTTMPHIYYLPLTEEEVQDKLLLTKVLK